MRRNRFDFLQVRDTLDWSLPPVWHLSSSGGNTPMKSSRVVDYTDNAFLGRGRFDLEGVTHIVAGRKHRAQFTYLNTPVELAGSAIILPQHQSPAPRPTNGEAGLRHQPVRCSGCPETSNRREYGPRPRDRGRPHAPLPGDASVSGTARIVTDIPERVVVDVKAGAPAYLVLADTFDPGWSATVNGKPAPIRAAYIAFRACVRAAGRPYHRLYVPAGGLRAGPCVIELWRVVESSLMVHAGLQVEARTRSRFTRLAPALADMVFLGARGDSVNLGGRHPRWASGDSKPVAGQFPSLHMGSGHRRDASAAMESLACGNPWTLRQSAFRVWPESTRQTRRCARFVTTPTRPVMPSEVNDCVRHGCIDGDPRWKCLVC